jgi:hypothetical protein
MSLGFSMLMVRTWTELAAVFWLMSGRVMVQGSTNSLVGFCQLNCFDWSHFKVCILKEFYLAPLLSCCEIFNTTSQID